MLKQITRASFIGDLKLDLAKQRRNLSQQDFMELLQAISDELNKQASHVRAGNEISQDAPDPVPPEPIQEEPKVEEIKPEVKTEEVEAN